MARTADPERAAARREAIMRAAIALFAERGFESTSAAEIAKAAGLSSGSVFYYFADKRAVFRALFERDLPAARELVARHATGADPVASLLAMVDVLAADAMDPLAPGIMVELVRQVDKDPELAQLIAETAATQHAGFAALVERGISDGSIDPELDPGEAAQWIQVAIDGAFLNADPDHDPRPMLRRMITRFLSRPCDHAGDHA
ncbi:DNA-binding transcriptional regulator, AcrR family [Saccharopolyspora antimicrobica]|uniref:DNA-binding transcriptional regulator, AcrR family n=1 Tax=Saccharopolyspora antimicrobica TaxID=455193 RepID=A0A1I5K320_9PSEU|nr:TetR family transcriptional regulator [Saccharopolyspora antimicrobica]RKT84758.1 TetR family transcriptional regulator [Saccharopolyspora antimicrobica]SFO79133.1 DNA-binding transcriptional regulator, AcrR family [Saccharopolyspora antimicrobica]